MEMTVEEFRRLVSYDPETGSVSWTGHIVGRWRPRAGKEIGWTDSDGYRTGAIRGRVYCLHRLAWFLHHGEWPPADIDHINGDRSDNRISNLRLATRKENSRNRKLHATNTSGFRGVTWDAKVQRWKAKIYVDGKTRNLGRFDAAEKASVAYERAAAEIFGEFIRNDVGDSVQYRLRKKASSANPPNRSEGK